MMHFALRLGPPTTLPKMGAGSTDPANDHHRSVFDLLFRTTCSLVESHDRPTVPDEENRRTPTLIAREAKPRVSSRARLDTAAARTLTNGKKRYSSVTMMTEPPMLRASIMVGARMAKDAQVAPTPTQRGVMALTRSALARKPSASAAHWMEFAAISFPSATATRPRYSDPIVIDAVKAAAAGANTSVTLVPGNAIGPSPLARTAPRSNPTSAPESCDCDDAKLSRSAISFSRVCSAAAMRV
mmetsp:Transcript_2521/g.6299  ORF Transcript_2521/g.6299 Transcript_2521/m.6299 type:complete len:242 (-) Transcript_2521:113-838(-)